MRISVLMPVLAVLLGAAIPVKGQEGYKISFHIKGLKDTTAYLGFYYGESTFFKDTARVNSRGEFMYDGKQSLPPGVYFLVLDRTRLFDFVVGKIQHFSLATEAADYVGKMTVTGDPDNTAFFNSMQFNVAMNREAEPYLKVINDSTLTEPAKKEAREGFRTISAKVGAYQDKLIAEHDGTVTAALYKASKPVAIPDPPRKANGSIDSTFQYRYYLAHYWDNFDLSNDALIRMPRPFYQEKVGEYLDKMFLQHPDTLTRAIRGMVEKARKNPETYKYLVWTCMVKYQNPEIMGLDAVYVNLYDQYFATGEMDFWANKQLRSNLKEQADKYRKSLIGMKGPNLIMQDANLTLQSMYAIRKKFTVLYFFDPDCGHCKKETPKLVEFYNQKKFDLEVYAICADTSMSKMKSYIKEMKMPWITVNGPRTAVGSYHDLYDAETTPTLYILDDKKKIIAKKLAAENLSDFLSKYERFSKASAVNRP
jgi:thiol-disulfide isomerase/thioredoxin